MAIPYEDLARIEEAIAISGGEPRTDAFRATLRGRVITSAWIERTMVLLATEGHSGCPSCCPGVSVLSCVRVPVPKLVGYRRECVLGSERRIRSLTPILRWPQGRKAEFLPVVAVASRRDDSKAMPACRRFFGNWGTAVLPLRTETSKDVNLPRVHAPLAWQRTGPQPERPARCPAAGDAVGRWPHRTDGHVPVTAEHGSCAVGHLNVRSVPHQRTKCSLKTHRVFTYD